MPTRLNSWGNALAVAFLAHDWLTLVLLAMATFVAYMAIVFCPSRAASHAGCLASARTLFARAIAPPRAYTLRGERCQVVSPEVDEVGVRQLS